ncbi:MAG: hypothetical protein H6741_05900 [Alphaproteobacteria bacterium]|nr:hypothetical protein [Alphaproteobacteria bacterium]MCB9792241.1 hypothetical protein [Alphaproteobacteria bacterium]
MTLLLLLLACGPKASAPDAPAEAPAAKDTKAPEPPKDSKAPESAKDSKASTKDSKASTKDSKADPGKDSKASAPPPPDPVSIPITPLAAPDFSSPEAALGTLIHAVQERDLEAYQRCFTQAAIEGKEAGVERLQGEGAERAWAELEGIFRGPLSFDVMDVSGDGQQARAHVLAPEAEGGGIGSLRFVRDAEGWKVDRW